MTRAPFFLVLMAAIWPVACRQATAADGTSTGNTDGVLVWDVGALQKDASFRTVVLFASGASYDETVELLGAGRRMFAKPSLLPDHGSDLPDRGSETGPNVPTAWIRNDVTDFALDAAGCFFWEGARQSLTGPKGGQLSRFGYYVHYDDGTARRAGTPILKKGSLENLRVVQPVRAVSATEAAGRMETLDGRIRIDVRAMMGSGAMAAVELVLTNRAAEPLSDVRLSVYANLESAHDPGNDYSVLDRSTGGLLFVDLRTKTCLAMAGLDEPAAGHSGTWASQGQLEAGQGVPVAQWKPFQGVPPAIKRQTARVSMPHPPAPHGKAVEPPTRTLTADEASELLTRDWLFQADGTPTVDRTADEIRWARQLAQRITKKLARDHAARLRRSRDPRTGSGLATAAKNRGTVSLAGELEELGRLQRQLEATEAADEPTVRQIYLAVRQVKRRIMLTNPAVDFSQVLLIDNPYPQGSEWPHQARHRNGMMAVPGGRLLVLEGLRPDAPLRKLAPGKPGSFWRPDLSFDAKRVLFCFKASDEKAFHLYEVNIDGSGVRQITDGDYDDLDPIYLPDGRIMFSTTRGNTYVRCMPYTYSYVLARCEADGTDIYLISQNNEPDWCPTLLDDGRVLYSRWEYTDKALWRIQSLWTTNQDGTGTAVFWGNQSVWPDHLAEARPIPGSPRVMFTGVAHHDWFAGSIGIIDPRQGFNFPDGLTKVTCDVDWPECGQPPIDPHESPDYHASGRYTAYKTPFPLSAEDFLVSARRGPRGDKFGLYLMDVHGNRELIYEGAYNIWHAMPIRPRRRPPVHPDRVVWPGTGTARQSQQPGTFFSPDIYEGVPELQRGSVKYVRVIQLDAKTATSWTRDARFSGPAISSLQEDGVKRILGTVPVESDGSVHFEVPSGKALHFQVLDEHYRALQTMRSFT
ncbi:MAG: hypothetical protein ACC645_20205, partial [Pirellulales bacterium]